MSGYKQNADSEAADATTKIDGCVRRRGLVVSHQPPTINCCNLQSIHSFAAESPQITLGYFRRLCCPLGWV